MSQVETVLGIESDFIKVLESLSHRECRFNRRLKDKTKKVAELLSRIAEVKRSLAAVPKAPETDEGGDS